MYQCDFPVLPKTITREFFIDNVFTIGYENENQYNTLLSAVKLADDFVEFKENIKCINPKNNVHSLMNEHLKQIYSVELAYVTISIFSKLLEDRNTFYPHHIKNCYLFKMEWEICNIFNFSFKSHDYFNLISNIVFPFVEIHSLTLNSMFFDLTKDICTSKSLLSINPITLFIGIFYLYKKGKLKTINTYKKRLFIEMILKISHEYEFPVNKVMKQFVLCK